MPRNEAIGQGNGLIVAIDGSVGVALADTPADSSSRRAKGRLDRAKQKPLRLRRYTEPVTPKEAASCGRDKPHATKIN
jgi:hypothetical protein